MKSRKYEQKGLLCCFIFILLFFITLFIIFLFYSKYYSYLKYNGILINKNIVLVLVEDDNLKYFYQNKYIQDDANKYSYKVKQVTKNVLTKNKNFYHEVLLKINFSTNLYKDQDIIEFSIKKKKIHTYNIFKIT